MTTTYTRAQAIADGYLIEADPQLVATLGGFPAPVAYTDAVFRECIAWRDAPGTEALRQDEVQREWDLLLMTSRAIGAACSSARPRGNRLTVELFRIPCDGSSVKAQRVILVATIGPGDCGEPVITIARPSEG
ncbi:hypothetical protein P3T27_007552 [Kitasatospora sp. MAA19]|uniref:DUF6573 family protein n=1 Tax=Kitasatospora sp. MAA19 TaxID=3035090 RepID=UPI00247708DB|nr:DUF6573 family protein [Kitasatospora sp. MAA19]MDH6710801.1 hypothetical protein [Kitasatospora sp. MAA19]